MTDKERVALARAMCSDFWAYYADNEPSGRAEAFLACVGVVLEFGKESKE